MGLEIVKAELRIIISSGAQSRVYLRGGGLLGTGGLGLFAAAEDDADGEAGAEAGGAACAAAVAGSAGDPASVSPSRAGAAGAAELVIAAGPASPSASSGERSALLPSPIPMPAPSATHTSSPLTTIFFLSLRGGSLARGKVGKLAGCMVEPETGDGSSKAIWIVSWRGTLGGVVVLAGESDTEETPGRLGEETSGGGGSSAGSTGTGSTGSVVAKLPRADATPRARTASTALAKRFEGSTAVIRANQASNPGGSWTPRSAARTLAGSRGPSAATAASANTPDALASVAQYGRPVSSVYVTIPSA